MTWERALAAERDLAATLHVGNCAWSGSHRSTARITFSRQPLRVGW